ncbi:MAG: NUDIX hydrolase, partial [Rhodocyclales bacterium]|nr:NUDIX hydrolase [Rhodocyclales bacterium]
PTALVGIYQWPRPQGDITYLRFAFAGTLGDHDARRKLDTGILRAVWMTPAEIDATRPRHRSPLIWQCVQDWQAGRRFPLDLIKHYG